MPAKPKPAIEEPEFFFDIEQRTAEWDDLRLGIPTASRFGMILAEGKDGEASKTRSKLLRILAGEAITQRPSTATFRNEDMERGIDDEPKARAWFERRSLVDLRPVGFIRRKLPSGRYIGCSPDGDVPAKNLAVEIKSVRPDIWIEIMDRLGAPPKHRAQCQGTIWIGGYDAIELIVFSDGMPTGLTYRIERDDRYIREELQPAVEVFDYELNLLIKKARERQ
jgi:YqaJ-like viral recombinase domain